MKNLILLRLRNLFVKKEIEPDISADGASSDLTDYERYEVIFEEEYRKLKQNPLFYVHIKTLDEIVNQAQEHDGFIKRRERIERLIDSFCASPAPNNEPDLEPD